MAQKKKFLQAIGGWKKIRPPPPLKYLMVRPLVLISSKSTTNGYMLLIPLLVTYQTP